MIQRKYLLIWVLASSIFFGCSSRILNLIAFNNNSKAIEKETQLQQNNFDKLMDDINNVRLKKELSKNDIISLYGKPILVKKIDRGSSEEWLYRSPLKYFDTPKIYLIFDNQEKLLIWRLG